MVSFTSKFAMLAAFSFAIIGANAGAVSTLSPEYCSPSPEDVFDPTILIPNANTKWSAGSVQNVTWSTANAPADISNEGIIVIMGPAENCGPSILAEGFSLLSGTQQITVPDCASGTDYFITLFGDSGNTSPQFAVVAA